MTNYGTNQSQEEFEDCIKQFLLLFMEKNISLDIKEWMSEWIKIKTQDNVCKLDSFSFHKE